jgi:hypothetical protein
MENIALHSEGEQHLCSGFQQVKECKTAQKDKTFSVLYVTVIRRAASVKIGFCHLS